MERAARPRGPRGLERAPGAPRGANRALRGFRGAPSTVPTRTLTDGQRRTGGEATLRALPSGRPGQLAATLDSEGPLIGDAAQ